MAILLPLPIYGCGTSDVEAFPSYIIRLASTHGISTGHILKILLSDQPQLLAGIQAGALTALVRPNTTTTRSLEAISSQVSASYEQLRNGTFCLLSPALKRSVNTYTDFIRWCPICFHEQIDLYGSSYLKLVWFLKDVETCIDHRVKLRSTCPHCNKIPRPMIRWKDIHICRYCSGSLDKLTSSDSRIVSSDLTSPDLVKLVADIGNRETPYLEGAANNYIAHIYEQAWDSWNETRFWKKLPRDDCLTYSVDNEPITLKIARKLAFRLEISINDLLEGGPVYNQSFGFSLVSNLPEEMQSGHRAAKKDFDLIKPLVKQIAIDGNPISLNQLAKDLNTTVGALRYHFPTYMARISANWKAFQAQEVIRKQTDAKEAVFTGISTWYGRNTRPLTRKGLLKDLRSSTGLPKNILIEAIRIWWIAAFSSMTNPN